MASNLGAHKAVVELRAALGLQFFADHFLATLGDLTIEFQQLTQCGVLRSSARGSQTLIRILVQCLPWPFCPRRRGLGVILTVGTRSLRCAPGGTLCTGECLQFLNRLLV